MRGITWLTLKERGIRLIWLSVLLERLKRLLLNLSLISAKLILAKQLRLVGLGTGLQNNLILRLSRGLCFSR